MQCNCKSRPHYHRDDCPSFYPDGTPRSHYEWERDFNKQLEQQIGDVIPFYFQFKTHSSFYRLTPIDRASGEIVSIEDVHEFIKDNLKVLCEKFFETTGNQVTYD